MAGKYTVLRAGKPVGEERFTITSSAAIWTVKSTLRLEGPLDSEQGYTLNIDEEAAEPVSFAVWFSLVGEKRKIVGELEQGFFRIKGRGLAGKIDRKIAYGRGTTIHFDSPLAHTLFLSLLLNKLEPGEAVPARTISVPLPKLTPFVSLLSYKLRGEENGLKKIEVRLGSEGVPLGLWVRPDGLPVKMRWLSTGGPMEMVLQGATPSAPRSARSPG